MSTAQSDVSLSVRAPAPAAIDARRTDPSPSHAVVRELATQFAGRISTAQIRAYVQDAVDDLRGSVSAEALPEMASRLAQQRLLAVVAPAARNAGR